MKTWFLLLVLAGCNKLSADECKREAAAIQTLLRSADTEPQLLYVDDKMQLVERTDLPATRVPSAPVVILDEQGVTYQGERIPGDLRARLTAARAQIVEDIEAGRTPRRDPPDPALVYFQIDKRTRWPRVVEAWQAARDAGMTSPGFVFGVPMTVTPPPRAPIDTELDALGNSDAANKATELANIISKQVEGCPAMIRAFGSIGAEDGGSKAKRLIDDLGPALVECKCNVDIPNFRSAMWRALANTKPTRVLRFDPAATPDPIALPATATWADAAAKLAPQTKNAELRVTE